MTKETTKDKDWNDYIREHATRPEDEWMKIMLHPNWDEYMKKCNEDPTKISITYEMTADQSNRFIGLMDKFIDNDMTYEEKMKDLEKVFNND